MADNKLATIKILLESKSKEFEKSLPTTIRVDKFIQMAMLEISSKPSLQKCSPASIYSALLAAGQLGLAVGGSLAQAYIIPYGDKAQFQLGYRGLIALARRSGEISTIAAYIVHEGDQFSYQLGTAPKIDHFPATKSETITHVYGIATLKDGSQQIEIMSRQEVEHIRDTYSRAAGKEDSPWRKSFGEMARKTVIRRLIKTLPISMELADQLSHEDDYASQTIDVQPNLERFQSVVAASDVLSDEAARAIQEKFKSICSAAKAMAVDISDLVSDVDHVLATTNLKVILAMTQMVESRIERAKHEYE